jgi:hypothetical protein
MGKLILLGDFNADLSKPSNYPGKALNEVINAFNLHLPCELESTRITSSARTVLDIIAVDCDIPILKYSTLKLQTSDHFPVSASISLSHSKLMLQPIFKRSYKGINKDELMSRISSINVAPNLQAEDATNQWYDTVNEILDDLAPVRRLPMRRNRSPFVTYEVRCLMHKRDKLARLSAVRNLTSEEIILFNMLKRKVVSKMRRVAKNLGESALQPGSNSHQTWKFISGLMFNAKGGGKQYIDADKLNEHFASIVTASHNETLATLSFCSGENSFTFQKISVMQVYAGLSTLEKETSRG